jgi:hypothetical protein
MREFTASWVVFGYSLVYGFLILYGISLFIRFRSVSKRHKRKN